MNAILSVANKIGISNEINDDKSQAIYEKLVDYLNELVHQDFNKLVSILYRINVSEQKVRSSLANTSPNQSAGEIIANLIIQREQEKIMWREKFKQGK